MRAALAHSATITPPWTLGPIVQCSFNSPSNTGPPGPASTSCSAIALLNRALMSTQQVGTGELERLNEHGFPLGGRWRGRGGHFQHDVAGEAARGQHLAHLGGRLGAATGHQVL